MVDRESGNVPDEWEGEEGVSDFLAVGGNHPIVSTEVTDRYPAEIHLKLRERWNRQIHPMASREVPKEGAITSSTTLGHPPY